MDTSFVAALTQPAETVDARLAVAMAVGITLVALALNLWARKKMAKTSQKALHHTPPQ